MSNAQPLSEVERLLRSVPCQRRLASIRKRLRGRWLCDVSFHPRESVVEVRLSFRLGEPPMTVYLPELALEELRVLARQDPTLPEEPEPWINQS